MEELQNIPDFCTRVYVSEYLSLMEDAKGFLFSDDSLDHF